MHRRVVYPVRFEGNALEKAVCIEEPLDYQQARATAESLAGFLRLPLVDRSSGEEERRACYTSEAPTDSALARRSASFRAASFSFHEPQ